MSGIALAAGSGSTAVVASAGALRAAFPVAVDGPLLVVVVGF